MRQDPVSPGLSPPRIVVVTATGTGIGKTWVACQVLRALAAHGTKVSARKPVQSLDPSEGTSDAEALARTTAEDPREVCPPERTFREPLAPPIAAARAGRVAPTITELAEIRWRDGATIGLIESAGGLCSPLSPDGDTRDLIAALRPAEVVLVTHSDLGVIHDTRASVAALSAVIDVPSVLTVYMNRFTPGDAIHEDNLRWLSSVDRLEVLTDAGSLAEHLLRRASRPVRPDLRPAVG